MTEGRRWDMFALPYGDGSFYGIGDFWYAQMHGGEPVAVVVTEDPEGNMLGWIDTGDDRLTMIQHERIFGIQFPYGPKAEVERGRGTIVRVRVEAQP